MESSTQTIPWHPSDLGPQRYSRYTIDELERRGREIYDRELRAVLTADPANKGKIVAIDVDTGKTVVDDSELVATDQLIEANPQAQIWTIRVGYRTVRSIGGIRNKE